MKKFILTAVAAASILSLAGCAQTAPAPVVTVTAQAPAPKPVDNSASYLAAIRADQPILAGVSDADLLSLGHKICTTLDNGATVSDVATAALQAAKTPEQANALGYIIGDAVASFCPQYAGQVQDFINNSGANA